MARGNVHHPIKGRFVGKVASADQGVQHVFSQVAVRVNDRTATASRDVLDQAVLQELALAASGQANHVGVELADLG